MDEIRRSAVRARGKDVAKSIAGEHRRSRVEVEICDRLVEEQAAGFPARARPCHLGMMRTEVRRIDACVLGAEQLDDACLDRVVFRSRKLPRCYSALIRHHHDGDVVLVQRSDRLGGARKQSSVRWTSDVVDVLDDGAVAVEKRGAAPAHVSAAIAARTSGHPATTVRFGGRATCDLAQSGRSRLARRV